MRVSVAVDRFLEQKRVERDWTERTIDSYGRTLRELADENPEATLSEFEGRAGRERLGAFIAKRYGKTSATTRATRISYFHSFFAWAEDEGHLEDNQARRIKRPPKRKPDLFRPTARELQALMHAATVRELPPLLLMAGAGLRAFETVHAVWGDVDLGEGLLRVLRKGQKWQRLPLDPIVSEGLTRLHGHLRPLPSDHFFVVEVERWCGQDARVRSTLDAGCVRSERALWRMVRRVSERAHTRQLHPQSLRRAFADGLIRDMRDAFGGADVYGLQFLMGHEDFRTTEGYLIEQRADDVAGVLRRLRADGVSQSHPLASTPGMYPGIPVVEAAGIEPASADAPV